MLACERRRIPGTNRSSGRLLRASVTSLCLSLVLIAPATAVSSAQTVSSTSAPNVVVILADDLDVTSTQVLLQGGWMPNVQRHLVDEGVSFSNFFVANAICCPSRATLLTGQYNHNHGVLSPVGYGGGGLAYWVDRDDAGNAVPRDELNTLATWLQDGGYRTALMGKYMNGYDGEVVRETYVPPGYDEWYGLLSTQQYQMYGYRVTHSRNGPAEIITPEDYQTDWLTTVGCDFIREHANHPFALFLMPTAPHIEIDPEGGIREAVLTTVPTLRFLKSITPPERYLGLTDGLADNGELPAISFKRSVHEIDMRDKPPSMAQLAPITNLQEGWIQQQWKDRLAATIAIDDMVGAVVETMREAGVLENTILVFTSDNGWFYGEHRLSRKLRPYEEALRCPLYIRGPASTVGLCDRLVINTDLAPTIVDLTGVEAQRDMDGRSLVPLLSGTNNSWKRQRTFTESYGVFPEMLTDFFGLSTTFVGLREHGSAGDLLYVDYLQSPASLQGSVVFTEFYDLSRDPFQLQGARRPGARQDAINFLLAEFRDSGGERIRHLEDLELQSR